MSVFQEVFQDVYLSFLIKGHTHFDPDQVFSRVATKLQVTNAFCPTEFIAALEQVYLYWLLYPRIVYLPSVCVPFRVIPRRLKCCTLKSVQTLVIILKPMSI